MSSRADLAVNFAFFATLVAPWLVYAGSRLAKKRDYRTHRAMQIAVLVFCWTAVFVLEGRIRFQGGSGSFVATAAEQWRPLARTVLLVHISGAVITYLAWTWLAVTSWRKFSTTLPGEFSRTHKRVAWAVLAGLAFTSLSAIAMYTLVFVL